MRLIILVITVVLFSHSAFPSSEPCKVGLIKKATLHQELLETLVRRYVNEGFINNDTLIHWLKELEAGSDPTTSFESAMKLNTDISDSDRFYKSLPIVELIRETAGEIEKLKSTL